MSETGEIAIKHLETAKNNVELIEQVTEVDPTVESLTDEEWRREVPAISRSSNPVTVAWKGDRLVIIKQYESREAAVHEHQILVHLEKSGYSDLSGAMNDEVLETSSGAVHNIVEFAKGYVPLAGYSESQKLAWAGELVDDGSGFFARATHKMAELHNHGVVHKDPHTGNFGTASVDENGDDVVKFIDFDQAKIIQKDDPKYATECSEDLAHFMARCIYTTGLMRDKDARNSISDAIAKQYVESGELPQEQADDITSAAKQLYEPMLMYIEMGVPV